jgi:hypothetical protein
MATDLCEFTSPDVHARPILYGDYVDCNCVSLNDRLKAYKTVNEINVWEATYSCDLCGENTRFSEIHKNEEIFCLCPNCSEQLESFPNGVLKESIERFLDGNVI